MDFIKEYMSSDSEEEEKEKKKLYVNKKFLQINEEKK